MPNGMEDYQYDAHSDVQKLFKQVDALKEAVIRMAKEDVGIIEKIGQTLLELESRIKALEESTND